MSKVIKNLFIFATGAVVGSFVTSKLIAKKYEQLMQDAIDDVKEVYSKKYTGEQQSEQNVDDDTEDNSDIIDACKEQIKNLGYTAEQEDDFKNYPYVIPPYEFGEKDGYQCITLTYYSDKILTDDDDRIIHNVEEIVGLESLNHFGEYEPDVVYVRNDIQKCDYEILADYGTYADLVERKPYIAED